MAVDIDKYAPDEDFVDENGLGHGGGMNQALKSCKLMLVDGWEYFGQDSASCGRDPEWRAGNISTWTVGIRSSTYR